MFTSVYFVIAKFQASDPLHISLQLPSQSLQFNKKYGIIPVTTNTVSPFDSCLNEK